MALEDLRQFLQQEKQRLFQAKDYIVTYYQQIIGSLISLRDNLFRFAYNQRQNWRDEIDLRATLINLPNLKLSSIIVDPEFNANALLNLINNLYAVQNAYCLNPSIIEKYDIKLIRKLHNFLMDYLNELYSSNNYQNLSKQQKELALSLKQAIAERLKNTLAPFFDRLEMILEDEYRVQLYPHIKMIVGTVLNYKKDSSLFDEMIAKKCAELGLRNYPELNLTIIADLEKSESTIENEIKAKYELGEIKRSPGKAYRLKEIALRYISQYENIQRLLFFLKETEKTLLRISLFQRLAIFLSNLLKGRHSELRRHTIYFSYLPPRGKIIRIQANLAELIKEINLYCDYLSKFREEMEFSSYTKSFSLHFSNELQRFIDTSWQSLNSIYEKCCGFREWLGRENNRKLLKRIPEKRQEELNEILLHLNRTVIVNNYSLREIENGT